MNNNAKNKKEKRQDLYVTVIVLLMMVAIISAVALSLARNPAVVDDPEESIGEVGDVSGEDTDAGLSIEDTEDVFLGDDDKKDTEKSEESDTASDGDGTGAETDETQPSGGGEEQRLPVLVAPVKGEVIKGCSFETPVYSSTMEDYRTHTGVDLYCDIGADVASAARGVIKEIYSDPMMGTCISIEHSGGVVSVYKNLGEVIPSGIEEGATVEAGQIIASAGDTAILEIAEDSHIHFELCIDGKSVDPCEYIEFSKALEE